MIVGRKDGQTPWRMSATPGSAPWIRTRHCNSTRLPPQDAPRFRRPCFRSACRSARPTAGARLCARGRRALVWKLDRLGRSLAHLIETVTAFETRGVGFRSITEAIDTTTPGGRLVFHLFGALGQFERDLIRERTRAGLAAAAARGRKGGRKPVVNGEKLARARSMVAKGLTVREAATRLKVGKTALYEALRLAAGEICHPLFPTAEKGQPSPTLTTSIERSRP